MKVWYLILSGAIFLMFATGCSKKGGPATPERTESAGAPQKEQSNSPSPAPSMKGGEGSKALPPKEAEHIQVTAPWSQGADIPMKYVHASKGGQNVSPAVSWSPVKGAVQYLVVMVDHHKVAHDWLHWVAMVPADTTKIPEGASGSDKIKEFPNTWGHARYEGPAAPSGTGKHDYHLVVFALSKNITLPEKPTWKSILEAIKGATIAKGEVVGYYETR